MGIVIRQAGLTTLFNYVGVVLGFVNLTVLMSHWFTVEQLGLTRLLLDIAIVNIQISHLGSFRSIVRFFPFFNKNGKTNGLLLLSLSLPMLGFLFVAAAFLLFKDSLIPIISDGSALFESYYWGIIPLSFFLLFNNVFEIYLQAHSQTVFASFLKTIFVRLLTMIALFLYYSEILDFNGFMIFFIFSYAFNVLLFIAHLAYKNLIDFKVNPKFFKKRVLKVYANYSLYSILTNISATMVTKIDAIMVASFLGLSFNGIYSMAVYISVLLYIPASQISKIAFPIISAAWRERRMDKIEEIYKKSSLNQLILGGLVYILIWASIDNFYALQKDDYALGKFVFLFLGLAQLITMAFGVNGIIINVSKYYRFDTVTSILLALFTIITNLTFIPIFGITGAAMATALSILLFNLVRYQYVLKKMKIQPFSLKTLGVIVILVVGFAVTFILPTNSNVYLDTIFKSIIIFIIIMVPIVYFKISEEINGFYHTLLKRFKS